MATYLRSELGHPTRFVSCEQGRHVPRRALVALDWPDNDVQAATAQVVRIGGVDELIERVSIISDDSDDDRVLEAAQAAGAALFVSGDLGVGARPGGGGRGRRRRPL
jgi:hypothetical protein